MSAVAMDLSACHVWAEQRNTNRILVQSSALSSRVKALEPCPGYQSAVIPPPITWSRFVALSCVCKSPSNYLSFQVITLLDACVYASHDILIQCSYIRAAEGNLVDVDKYVTCVRYTLLLVSSLQPQQSRISLPPPVLHILQLQLQNVRSSSGRR